ncbi:hypothetical protein [Arthrobacter sp. GMC3]|uniref:hypothetical protein n=1 Tax=Arthrobacter sp. GMC3 TaxID=2058894 RepID=UPI000CE38E3A|nr:hypothetical protein [Arthrobacter sp. GMC3]
MPEETKDLAWVLPLAVQLILPIVLVILTGAGTWMVAKIRAKNERIKQEQDHALAIAAQQADFDGRKRAAGLARDQQQYDTMQTIIGTLQAGQRDSAHREARMDEKFNELYGNLGSEREYSTEWEDWHRDGMPNPPGKPRRRPRIHHQATPTGGSLI